MVTAGKKMWYPESKIADLCKNFKLLLMFFLFSDMEIDLYSLIT
jgi:hypothetical protein